MSLSISTPPDFDQFWAETLAELRTVSLRDTTEPDLEWSSSEITVEHVTYQSLGNACVHGWLFIPNGPKRGALLYLPGYNASTHTDLLMRVYRQMAAAGLVLLGVDPRGQGASKAVHPPAPDGKLLTGISSPQEHIYRGIVADCVQGARYLAQRAAVPRVGVGGHSQGGGLAIMTASLFPAGIDSVSAMIPFLTHYRMHAAHQQKVGPYREITTHIEAQPDRTDYILQVLSYFDTLTHAHRVKAPTLMGVGRKDTTCPPESVLALYEALPATKGLLSFPEMGHVNSPDFYHHVVQWHLCYLQPERRTLTDLRLG